MSNRLTVNEIVESCAISYDDYHEGISCFASKANTAAGRRNVQREEKVSRILREGMSFIRKEIKLKEIPMEDTDFNRIQALSELQECLTMARAYTESSDANEFLNQYAIAMESVAKTAASLSYIDNLQLNGRNESGYTVDISLIMNSVGNISNSVEDISLKHFENRVDIYATGNLSRNNLVRIPEVPGYKNYYKSAGATLGAHFKLRDMGMPWYMRGTGPILEAQFDRITGSGRNENSSRDYVGMNLGWRQYIAHYGHITPKVSAGGSYDILNFGKGNEPEHNFSGLLGAGIFVGGDIPLSNNISLSLEVGYNYQESVLGEEHYRNQGPQVVLGVKPARTRE
jgi:hypothetical protein